MDKYINYYKNEILENQKILIKLIDKVNGNTPIKKVKKLVTALCMTSTGVYASHKLEEYFINIANKEKIELDDKYLPNSTLHVLTQAYDSGGHTRVVERWIENASAEQEHYVFITNQDVKDVSDLLKKRIKDKSRLYIEKNTDDVKVALKLRKIASGFEKIILHTHMDDVIPLIAFGTEDFKRPILLYNHADHLGWVGISIADLILELRQFGMKITKYRRGCERQYKLGIPIYKPHTNELKTKKELNLPEDKLIIFSCGSEHKYIPILDINIFELVKYITNKYNVLFIIVGINNVNKFNIEKYRIKSDNLLIFKHMNHTELMSYINVADIVLDSFPMSGATALTDAIALNKPVVSGCSMVGQLDYIIHSPYYSRNMEQLKNGLEELVNSSKKRMENLKIINELIEKEDSLTCFKNHLLQIENIRPHKHSIYKFNEIITDDIIENDVFRYTFDIHEKVKLDLGWLKIIKYKNMLKKWIIIRVINKQFKINLGTI